MRKNRQIMKDLKFRAVGVQWATYINYTYALQAEFQVDVYSARRNHAHVQGEAR